MLYQDIICKKYLSSGFERFNSQNFEIVSKSYELNYNELIACSQDAKIIDIGCGMGHFLYYLKKQGYKNFWGIDIGLEQIESCRKNITKNVDRIENIFDFLNDKQNYYDLIILNDVLEHFNKDDIIKLLQQLLFSLKVQGRLIIRTPNMANLFAASSFYIDFTHEVGFSEISLVQILKAVGFRRTQCRQERIYIASPVKRIFFYILKKIYYTLLKFIILLDRPGDKYPTIFSKNLIVWADK